jgi:hypothetical protein
VVVMARELTLKQVGDIVKNIQRNQITGHRVTWYKSRFLRMVLCVWLFLENVI